MRWGYWNGVLGLIVLSFFHGYVAADRWPASGLEAVSSLGLTALCVVFALALTVGSAGRTFVLCIAFAGIAAIDLDGMAQCAFGLPVEQLPDCALRRTGDVRDWSWAGVNYGAVFLIFGLLMPPPQAPRDQPARSEPDWRAQAP